MSADQVQKMVRRRLGLPLWSREAPSLMKVARSLARLAKQDAVVQMSGDGSWRYTSTNDEGRIPREGVS